MILVNFKITLTDRRGNVVWGGGPSNALLDCSIGKRDLDRLVFGRPSCIALLLLLPQLIKEIHAVFDENWVLFQLAGFWITL